MNKVLIRNFNSMVHKNDTVYLLGDVTHRVSLDEANELISKLNGHKILICGNHDKNMMKACLKIFMIFWN